MEQPSCNHLAKLSAAQRQTLTYLLQCQIGTLLTAYRGEQLFMTNSQPSESDLGRIDVGTRQLSRLKKAQNLASAGQRSANDACERLIISLRMA